MEGKGYARPVRARVHNLSERNLCSVHWYTRASDSVLLLCKHDRWGGGHAFAC